MSALDPLRTCAARSGAVLTGMLVAGLACSPGRDARIDEVMRRSRSAPERIVELESPYLLDRDQDVRALAAWAIGEAASPGAAASLAPLVDDPDADVRRAVTIALCKTGGEGAAEGLVRLASDQEAAVRRAAIRCFAESASPPPEPLARALGDQDRAVRTSAIGALARHPDRSALQGLEEILRTRGAEEQRAAVSAIRALGDPGALPALETAAGSRLAPPVRDAVEATILELRKVKAARDVPPKKRKPAEDDPLPAARGGGDG